MRHVTFISKSFFIVGLMWSSFVFAEETDVYVGVGLMAFNYAEFDDDNVFLDGETGLIPGAIIKFKTQGKVYAEWVGRFYYNQINYDGETQITKIPVTTTSDAFIMDAHVKIGNNLDVSYERQQAVYFGLGYRYWLRNILPSVINAPSSPDHGKKVAGLFEEYYWFYGLLGYQVSFNASDDVKVGFDFRLTKMMNAKIDIDHLGFGGYDNNTLDLGNKLGARLSMPIEIKASNTTFYVTPYYEIIDIGKSNSDVVTVNGLPINRIITEPRSETRNVGVELTWLW